MVKITELAHKLILDKEFIKTTVDMTCGRGNDTLFLAKISEKVFAFDIQKEAIDSTRKILEENEIKNVTLINDDHKNISSYIKEPIDVFLYNLGYLPQGNKTIKTEAKSTIASLKEALLLLNHQGLILLVMYSHNQEEIELIMELVKTLSIDYDCINYRVLNRENCPQIVTIKKG